MSIANKLQIVADNLATENEKIVEQASLLAQISEALDGKTGTMGGGGGGDYDSGYADGYADGYEDGEADGYNKCKASYDERDAYIVSSINNELESVGVSAIEGVLEIPSKIDAVYDKGYEDGTAQGGGGEDDLPYGYLKVDPTWTDFAYFCNGRRYSLGENLKYSDTANGTNFLQMFYGWDSAGPHIIPSLDLRKGTNFQSMFQWSATIVEIGEMDISNAANVTGMFGACSDLERISFVPECIKISISFANSGRLNDDSIQSIVDGLADLTGKTAQTLTLHATVGAKLTQAQKDAASAKNWTLAY